MIDPVTTSTAFSIANDFNNLAKNIPSNITDAVVNVLDVLSPRFMNFHKKIRERDQKNRVEEAQLQFAIEGKERELEKSERLIKERFPHLVREEKCKENVAKEFLNDLSERQKEDSEVLQKVSAPDTDWMAQFADYSKNCSSEEMQRL